MAFFFTLTFSLFLSAMEKDKTTFPPENDVIQFERPNDFDTALELYKELGNGNAWPTLKEEIWKKQLALKAKRLSEKLKEENQSTEKVVPAKPAATINFEETHNAHVISEFLEKLQKRFSLNSTEELKQFFHDELKVLMKNTDQQQLSSIQEFRIVTERSDQD